MKLADISLGHKKDDNLKRGNYIPVTVLPIFSQVYEIVTNEELFSYFVDKFHAFLSAFRKRYNCQSLLLKAVDDRKFAPDHSLITEVVFYGSVESFGLFILQLTDSETSCLWCWLVCPWASCGQSESPPAACKNRNRTKLMDGINQRGTVRLNGRTLIVWYIPLWPISFYWIMHPLWLCRWQCFIRHQPCKMSFKFTHWLQNCCWMV